MGSGREGRRALRVILGICLAMAPALARASAHGPDDGVAGDPPISFNCTICHDSYPVGSGNGALVVSGLPAEYQPGAQYSVNIRLSDPGQRRWGFEMTVIDDDGYQCGDMSPALPAHVQLSPGAGTNRDYIKHTLAGTQPGAAFGTWDVIWQAPPAGAGTANFYVAGNAANWNGVWTGDYIYVRSVAVAEAVATTVAAPAGATEGAAPALAVGPNPLRQESRVRLALPTGGPARVTVHDARGRLVRELAAGFFPAGVSELRWDGRDAGGERVASGVYHLELQAAEGRTAARVIVLR